MEKLILVDGNAILHRAYHAMPPFRAPDGRTVNAVYGFASMILTILKKENPDYLAVTFDMKGKTFRHEEYEDYKATRVKAPDELYEQIPLIKELVEAFNFPVFEKQGLEADDLLGTLAVQAEKKGNILTYIVTGDMDTLQMVTEKTKIYTPHKGFSDVIIYDIQKILARYGLSPKQIPDLKGLQGDNSDNIKGVRGIGPVTAKSLLQKYGTVENIYNHLEEIPENLRSKLIQDKDNAFFSKRLATLILDAPIDLDLEKCHLGKIDPKKITAFFEKLGFKSLIKKFEALSSPKTPEKNTQKPSNSNPQQESLF